MAERKLRVQREGDKMRGSRRRAGGALHLKRGEWKGEMCSSLPKTAVMMNGTRRERLNILSGCEQKVRGYSEPVLV